MKSINALTIGSDGIIGGDGKTTMATMFDFNAITFSGDGATGGDGENTVTPMAGDNAAVSTGNVTIGGDGESTAAQMFGVDVCYGSIGGDGESTLAPVDGINTAPPSGDSTVGSDGESTITPMLGDNGSIFSGNGTVKDRLQTNGIGSSSQSESRSSSSYGCFGSINAKVGSGGDQQFFVGFGVKLLDGVALLVRRTTAQEGARDGLFNAFFRGRRRKRRWRRGSRWSRCNDGIFVYGGICAGMSGLDWRQRKQRTESDSGNSREPKRVGDDAAGHPALATAAQGCCITVSTRSSHVCLLHIRTQFSDRGWHDILLPRLCGWHRFPNSENSRFANCSQCRGLYPSPCPAVRWRSIRLRH